MGLGLAPPPPSCIAHTIAIRYYNPIPIAHYTTPRPPFAFCMPYTIQFANANGDIV